MEQSILQTFRTMKRDGCPPVSSEDLATILLGPTFLTQEKRWMKNLDEFAMYQSQGKGNIMGAIERLISLEKLSLSAKGFLTLNVQSLGVKMTSTMAFSFATP